MIDSEKSAPQTAKRDHLFKPGVSGNPKGRPPGTSVVQKLRAAIGDCVPEILEKLKEQAREGDVAAARVLLERVLPPIKASDETQVIDIPEDGDLTAKGQAVLRAAANGLIPVSQAASLMASIGSLARVVEVDELSRRLAVLEAKSGTSA
ncbi:DUF5681 domain-containing protein [Variovorax saccharolyticus]|uniref:DUF5681 domain-containing protein n=1 Tax=Variovorax saccharolyticus TaxID=3053516 RepID=UPI002578F901|nr:DUF5681 domain-containing protein [Variovorax sp. J31P216]MDM0025928.1 DUF5681 domain-containing protein [Variovorax sp. J31P216]